jgi:hypothetical protein
MGHHKVFNDEIRIPKPVVKRAQRIALICAILGLGSSFTGYFMSDDTHVVDQAHADRSETKADAAKADVAKTDTAKADAAKADAAKADVAKADAAKMDTHKADAHKADAAKADAHKADAHKADAHKADAHKADAHKADAHKADAHKADAHKADAHKADAHGAGHDDGHGGGHGAVSNRKQFFFSWLTAFFYFTTLCLGGLFFTILHHLVRSSWSTTLRRIAENLAMNIVVMAVCALVLILGFEDLFHWSTIKEGADPILDYKAGYLNTEFFTIRSVGFFVIWIAMALFFRGRSVKQDHTSSPKEAEALNFKMRSLAPLSMLTFALSLTFFAFDWLMSLDHHWFSTMFGVYIFAGTVVSLFATLIVVMLWFSANGVLKNTISVGNFHDAGKLMFGFIVFWTYITFSQYFLIWYANIPEETGWYIHRAQGGWEHVGLAVVVGHFILPFWVIMSRHTKRNRAVLGMAAAWMLIMHFIDLYYVVMPTLHPQFHFHWMDVTTFVGIGGLFVLGLIHWLDKDAVIAYKDPQLIASMEYDNA